MSQEYLAGITPPPPMTAYGTTSTAFLRWKANAEAIKRANARVVERYGTVPSTETEWEEARVRLRRDEIADILGKELPAARPIPNPSTLWRPATPQGVAIDRLLGELNAGITVLRRAAGAAREADFEALRDVLAEIADRVREMDMAVAL